MCITTVNYSIMMNNDRVGPIFPSRGLKQGDPLSSYLFIICAEGLTSLIKHAERRGLIHGVQVCRRAHITSHILFTDDGFLFYRAKEDEARELKNILSTYANAFGQFINLLKSEIYFSRNADVAARDALITILEAQECLGTGKYLGLPSMIDRSKKSIFKYIKDRVWKKME